MSRYTRYSSVNSKNILVAIVAAIACVVLCIGTIHVMNSFKNLEVTYGNEFALSGTGGYLLDDKDLVFSTNHDNVKAKITLARDVTLSVDSRTLTLQAGKDLTDCFDVEIDDGDVIIESTTAGKVFQKLYPRSSVEYSIEGTTDNLFRLTIESNGDSAFYDFSCIVPVVEGVEVNGSETV